MKKVFLIIISLLFTAVVFAQEEYSLEEEIKKLIPSSDIQEYNQAQDLIKQGDKLRSEADQLQQQADDLKANINTLKKSKRKKATKQYNELYNQALEKYNGAYVKYLLAYKKLYNIYDKILQDLSSKINSENKPTFDRYITLSHESYKTSMGYVKKGVAEKKDLQKKNNFYKQAYEMIKRTMSYQEQAFKLYFDQIYTPKTQVVASQPKEETQQQVTTQQTQIQREPIVIHDEPTNQQTQQQTKPRQQAQQTRHEQPTYIYNPPEQTNQQPPHATQQAPRQPITKTQTSANVYFRVQIAASSVKLSQQKLRQIYSGRIYEEFDPFDRRYKYLTYEKFQTYDQARNFKSSCGVRGAFVVAYKNGKRLRDICEVVPCH